MKTVAVVGATGFLGAECVRLLASHPGFELRQVCSGSSAGKRLGEVRPGLVGAADLLLTRPDPDTLARADAVVLALPHGTSGELGAAILERGGRVLDLGSDFRLKAPADHQRWYGRAPAAPRWLEHAVYSLPELTGPIPAGTRLVANPGCFATALALSLAPLAARLSGSVHAVGVTGSSGSGASPSTGVHHSLRRTDFKAYKALRHQHLGEVTQLLATRGPVPDIAFVPHSGPFVRGIHLTLTFRREQLDGDALVLLGEAYERADLVAVSEGPVHLGGVVGTVRAELGVAQEGGHVAVFCAIDNLLKGGSGQAVQNLNLWFDEEPLTGLPLQGMWP